MGEKIAHRHTYSRRATRRGLCPLALPGAGWGGGGAAHFLSWPAGGAVGSRSAATREWGKALPPPGGHPPAGTQAREENPASPRAESEEGQFGRKEEGRRRQESGRLQTSGALRRGPGPRPPAALRSLGSARSAEPAAGASGDKPGPSAAGSPRKATGALEHSSRAGCAHFCGSCRPHRLPGGGERGPDQRRGSDPERSAAAALWAAPELGWAARLR